MIVFIAAVYVHELSYLYETKQINDISLSLTQSLTRSHTCVFHCRCQGIYYLGICTLIFVAAHK